MLQVVGSRGPTEVNPRNLMVTESSITGVALGTATPVSLGGSSWLFLCHTLSQLLNATPHFLILLCKDEQVPC